MDASWLEQSYDAFPRIEEVFHTELDKSLHPRGPHVLYDLVGNLELASGSIAVDVGCGEGAHAIELATRFGFDVTGIDPVPRHIELAHGALAALPPGVRGRVRFQLGAAEALPLADRTVELVWCRDVLVHVAELSTAYSEFARVLQPGGRVVVYQMFGADRLQPCEAEWLWKTMGVVPGSADTERTELAISAAGLRVDERLDLGTEWGEWAEEQSGKAGRRLLYAARLLRDPQRYISQFGKSAYEIMLGDCLWHVYGMIGKLDRRVYVLSRA